MEEIDYERFSRDVEVTSFEATVNGHTDIYHRIDADWLQTPIFLGPDGYPVASVMRIHLESKLQGQTTENGHA